MLNASDIQTLEERWKKWKFKRLAKKFSFIGLFFSVFFLGLYFLNQHFSFYGPTKKTFAVASETKEAIAPVSITQVTNVSTVESAEQFAQSTASAERPSLVIHAFPREYSTQEPASILLPPTPEVLPFQEPHLVPETTKNSPPQKMVETLEITPPRIDIEYKTVQRDTTAYLKEKFDTTKNIVFALMLSEEYYGLKDYQEAHKWALIANGINPKNERSWILFAMAQAKSDNTKEAIVALEEFLKNNSSTNAQLLLDKLKKGTFK